MSASWNEQEGSSFKPQMRSDSEKDVVCDKKGDHHVLPVAQAFEW